MSCVLEVEGCLFAWRFWDILCVDGAERCAFLRSMGNPTDWDRNSLVFVAQLRGGRTWSAHPDQGTSSIWTGGGCSRTLLGFRLASCHALLRQFFNGEMDRLVAVRTFLDELDTPATVLVGEDRLGDTCDILRSLGLVLTPVCGMPETRATDALVPPMLSGSLGGLRGVHLRMIKVCLAHPRTPVPSLVELLREPPLSVLAALWILVLRVPRWAVLPMHHGGNLSGSVDVTTGVCVSVVRREVGDVHPKVSTHLEWLHRSLVTLLSHPSRNVEQLRLLKQVVEAHIPPGYASRNVRWSRSYAASM